MHYSLVKKFVKKMWIVSIIGWNRLRKILILVNLKLLLWWDSVVTFIITDVIIFFPFKCKLYHFFWVDLLVHHFEFLYQLWVNSTNCIDSLFYTQLFEPIWYFWDLEYDSTIRPKKEDSLVYKNGMCLLYLVESRSLVSSNGRKDVSQDSITRLE